MEPYRKSVFPGGTLDGTFGSSTLLLENWKCYWRSQKYKCVLRLSAVRRSQGKRKSMSDSRHQVHSTGHHQEWPNSLQTTHRRSSVFNEIIKTFICTVHSSINTKIMRTKMIIRYCVEILLISFRFYLLN